MELSSKQVADLFEALLDAFSRAELARVVYFALGEDLDHITGSGSDQDVFFELIKWTQRNGQTEILISAAQEAKPRNPRLGSFIQSLDQPLAQSEPGTGDATTSPGEGTTQSQTIYHVDGDLILGGNKEVDNISVGNIIDSAGVAIGRSSSATSVSQGASEQTQKENPAGQDLSVKELHRQLVDQFNLEELGDLCFELGIDFEDLGGTSKSAKARELVLYMQRRKQLDRLSLAIQQKRS